MIKVDNELLDSPDCGSHIPVPIALSTRSCTEKILFDEKVDREMGEWVDVMDQRKWVKGFIDRQMDGEKNINR